MLSHLNVLRPTVQIRLDPRYGSPRYAKLCLQPLCRCRVADRVEGCRQVETNQYCDLLVVSSSVDALEDIDQYRLC